MSRCESDCLHDVWMMIRHFMPPSRWALRPFRSDYANGEQSARPLPLGRIFFERPTTSAASRSEPPFIADLTTIHLRRLRGAVFDIVNVARHTALRCRPDGCALGGPPRLAPLFRVA